MPQMNFATPRATVKLFKSISRTVGDQGLNTSVRYQNRNDFIDLTDFIGDGGSITTTKALDAPSGTFTISFADKAAQTGEIYGPAVTPSLESVYGLVEPMDAIEIRMWSGVGKAPNPLPIKMRGIVTRIRRERSMGSDGKPRNMVVITGHDYGKFLQIYQLLYLSGYDGAEPLLTAHSFFEQFGMDVPNSMTCAEFVTTLLDKAINPMIESLFPDANSMPHQIIPDLQATGMMSNSFQNERGSVYDLARTYMDVSHWNEFYVEDREDGVYLVWRPKPYVDLVSGDAIQQLKTAPNLCVVDNDWILSLTQQRDDEDVHNYFYVSSQRWQMIDDRYQQIVDAQNNYHQEMLNYPNTNKDFYGLRPFAADSATGPEDAAMKNMGTGQDQPTQDRRTDAMTDWLLSRRQICVDSNKDNVVFESGDITMKGGPVSSNNVANADGEIRAAKVGDYFKIQEGNMSWYCYATVMTDTFSPFRSYTTTVSFVRGTGFGERVSVSGGNSPYLTEKTGANKFQRFPAYEGAFGDVLYNDKHPINPTKAK